MIFINFSAFINNIFSVKRNSTILCIKISDFKGVFLKVNNVSLK